ncbi:MAG: hypothetical protein J6B91_08785 [Prevotella sp.]|nr:hypothetical protein [Prevotella sp.]
MISSLNMEKIQSCLDDYMVRIGKIEINEIEANRELARTGLMTDDTAHPGRPLRNFLRKLRDTDLLPKNIRQINCAWSIKHSKVVAKMQQILPFL